MAATINGALPEAPPDSTGAIGPSHYVEMVNSAIAVYSRATLTLVTPAKTLQAWLGVDPAIPYCDPQIQWDPSAGRWLYAFLYCNLSSSSQGVHFGWSKTSDPSSLATGWCHYVGTTSPYLYDFPKLGHSSNYILIGANAFDETNPSPNPTFVGSRVVWVKKPANTVHTCPAASTLIRGASPFPLRNPDNTVAFTPVPVNTTTSSGNGYVVSAHYPFGAPQTKLAVWHLDSVGGWHANNDIPVAQFSVPNPAPQLGSTNTIDTSDGRLTQAVGDPTTGIWTQHTVNGLGNRSVVRWYEIKVSAGLPLRTQQGDIASPTDFVFNGAVSPRFDGGGAAVVYNRSNATTIDPVIAAQIRVTATPSNTMEPGEIVLATSPAADTETLSCAPCRWGDYSGASPDPIVQNVVWGTSELNTASGPTPAWADQNFALLVAIAPHAPTPVSATAGDSAATVFWTPSPFDPGSPVISYKITSYVGGTAGPQVTVTAPATSAYFPGLINGVTYTFTVTATNIVGDGLESAQSNPVTPPRQVAQASPPPSSPAPARSPVTQSTPNPGPPR